jgi:mannose/fructose-specific phosphotransferase system component IIA
MRKIFLVSHNHLAQGMKDSAEMIAGKQENLKAYGLMPGGHPSQIRKAIADQISSEDDVLILGDIAGGSVCNEMLELTLQENVTLVAGMSLPLVLEMILLAPTDSETMETIIVNGQSGMKRLVLNPTSEEVDFF